MRPVPAAILRRLLPLLAGALAVSALSCDSSRLISGVYRSEDSVYIRDVAGFSDGCWVELMLAQFGPDLTGIVRVFDEDQFIVPATGMCACRYLEDGKVVDQDLSFAFRSNGDCPGSDQTPLVIASFTFDKPDTVIDGGSGEYLTGTLVVEGGDRTTASTITLRRVRAWGDLSSDDLLCDDPLVHGEAASGLVSRGTAE